MSDETRPEYGSDEHRQEVLAAVEKSLLQPDAEYRLVSADREWGRWVALLIERNPTHTGTSLAAAQSGRYAAHSHTTRQGKAPACPASSPDQRSTEAPLDRQARHIEGIESLAVLARGLLLDAAFLLSAKADSLNCDLATQSQRHVPKSEAP